MTKRQTLVCVAILAALAAAVFVLFTANRRAKLQAARPAWLDPEQPPENVMPTGAGWAPRAAHLSASCYGPGGRGSHTMRHYPSTLAESRGSFIRTSAELEARI